MTDIAKTKEKNGTYYIHCLVGLMFMFGIGQLPEIGPITHVGMQVAGIFLGLIYLWSSVGLFWPSLIGVLALGMSDAMSLSDVIAGGLGNSNVFQMITCMIMVGALTDSGAGEYIARWIITRRALNGRPLLFSMVLLVAFWFPAIAMGSIGIIFLGWAIIEALAGELGYEMDSPYVKMMTVGTFTVAMAGSATLPFRGWRASLAAAYGDAVGQPMNYGVYIFCAVVVGLVFIVLYVLAMKYVFKADFSKLQNVNVEFLESKSQQKLGDRQRIFMISFLLVVLYILAITLLPADWAVIKFISPISSTGIFAFAVGILCLVKKEGEPLLNFQKISSKYVEWRTILVCMAALPIASALMTDDTGIKVFFSNILQPVFAGKSAFFLIACVCVTITVLTNVGSNIGMGLLLIPIVAPFVTQLGVKTDVAGIAIVYLANLAYILPGASAIAGLLYSRKNLMAKDVYKYGGTILVMYCLLMMAVLMIYNVI